MRNCPKAAAPRATARQTSTMKPSHRINWRTSPDRLIKRDASVDACGMCVETCPPPMDRYFLLASVLRR